MFKSTNNLTAVLSKELQERLSIKNLAILSGILLVLPTFMPLYARSNEDSGEVADLTE